MIGSSLGRGIVCASSYSVPAWLEGSFDIQKCGATGLYGFMTFPIIICNYRYTYQLLHKKMSMSRWSASVVNELVLWPVNTLPLLYVTQGLVCAEQNLADAWREYVADVIPISVSSALFWVPFTALQYRVGLYRFAPYRFSAGFLYNTCLMSYMNRRK